MGLSAIFSVFGKRYINSKTQFSKLVDLPLIGVLNKLNPRKVINFDYLFLLPTEDQDDIFFKDSLKNILQSIEKSNSKSFLFTSIKSQEGKSFIIAALAYKLSLQQKKVLILDTNLHNNTLTRLATNPFQSTAIADDIAAISAKSSKLSIDFNLAATTIIGNKRGQRTPAQLLKGVDFKKKIKELEEKYDYIFLESADMNTHTDTAELMELVDKVICVFDAEKPFTPQDELQIEVIKKWHNKLLGCILNNGHIKTL
jgi:polysaccharide biosynthesis transport protein